MRNSKEINTSWPSLESLVADVIQRFRGQRSDPSGLNPYNLGRAAEDVLSNSGINPQELLLIISRSPTQTAGFLSESRGKDWDTDEGHLLAASILLLGEVMKSHPEIIDEEVERFASFRQAS